MTEVTWDDIGTRFFETGIDRGVLYVGEEAGVPWNGLTGIEENRSQTRLEPLYFNGVKYFDLPTIGDFSGTLKAITYPDEFLKCEGINSIEDGYFADGQNLASFGLSYRTLVGNDTDGTDHGYKIHLLYNLTATPANAAYETLSGDTNPTEFSWSISSRPILVPGFRPTAHFIIDTRTVSALAIHDIEHIIHGDEDTIPHLPTIEELIDIIGDAHIIITDLGDGLWSAEGEDPYVTTDGDTFTLTDIDVVFSDDDTFELTVNG